MKKILLAAFAAFALSGCIFDEEFWDDSYDSVYDSPSGDDCDCEEFFSFPPAASSEPLQARPR